MCQSEPINGLPASSGPGPPGGGCSSNGRSLVSPCLSAPSSIKSSGSVISPSSLPSSSNTSPIRMLSAPTTPSTVSFKTKTTSSVFQQKGSYQHRFQTYSSSSVVSSRLKTCAEFLHSKNKVPDSGKNTLSQQERPDSPDAAVIVAVVSKSDSPYTPSLDRVPRTNAANKRLRKDMNTSRSPSEQAILPPAKRTKQYLTNGYDDECSRDSVLSVISTCSDRPFSRNSDEIIIEKDISPSEKLATVADNSISIPPTEVKQEVASAPQQQPVRRSGRKRKKKVDENFTTYGLPHSAADPLRQKMAVIGASNSSRVKTTSELLFDLAEKKGDVRLARRASKLEERRGHQGDESIKRNKLEHMEKFLKSTPGPHSPSAAFSAHSPQDDDDDDICIIDVEDSDDEHHHRERAPGTESPEIVELTTPLPPLLVSHNPNSPLSNVDLLGITEHDTEEEILARLPALNLNDIQWDDEHGDLLGKVPSIAFSSGINPDDVDEDEIMSDSSSSDDNEMEAKVTGPEGEIVERSENNSNNNDKKTKRKKRLSPAEKLMKRSEQIDRHVVDTLHTTNVECQNGNFDMDGRFREWHELILQKGYQDAPLVVLPYVVAEF